MGTVAIVVLSVVGLGGFWLLRRVARVKRGYGQLAHMLGLTCERAGLLGATMTGKCLGRNVTCNFQHRWHDGPAVLGKASVIDLEVTVLAPSKVEVAFHPVRSGDRELLRWPEPVYDGASFKITLLYAFYGKDTPASRDFIARPDVRQIVAPQRGSPSDDEFSVRPDRTVFRGYYMADNADREQIWPADISIAGTLSVINRAAELAAAAEAAGGAKPVAGVGPGFPTDVSVAAYLEQRREHLQGEDVRAASTACQERLATHPYDLVCRYDLGVLLELSATLTSLISRSGGSSAMTVSISHVKSGSPATYNALLQFTRIITDAPDCAHAWYALGRLQDRLGHFKEARAAYQRVRALVPADDGFLRELMAFGAFQSDWAMAIEVGTRLLPSAKDPGELHERLGTFYLAADQAGASNVTLGQGSFGTQQLREHAEEHLLKALELKIDEPYVSLQLAGLYERTDRYDQAVKYYTAWLESEPDDEEARVSLGRLRARPRS